MKGKINFKNFIFYVLVLILAIFIYFNQIYFKTLISTYIYEFELFGIFIFSFLADVLFQPIGPEVPALIGVFFNLNLMGIIGVTLLGSYLASMLNYSLSRQILFRNQKKYSDKGYRKLIKKYGKFGVSIAAITPVPWVPFCWFAGRNLKLRNFILYGLVPRTFRILIVILGADFILKFLGF